MYIVVAGKSSPPTESQAHIEKIKLESLLDSGEFVRLLFSRNSLTHIVECSLKLKQLCSINLTIPLFKLIPKIRCSLRICITQENISKYKRRSYRKKFGHEKEQCYKLVGYPSHFNINKPNRGSYEHQQVLNAESSESFINGAGGNALSNLVNNQSFSKEQCDNLIQLFQSMQAANSNVQGGSSNASISEPNATANLAGATQHMTFDESLLHDVIVLKTLVMVHLPNSYKFPVHKIGKIYITSQIVLHNVLFVPIFWHNLLSVKKLCEQFNCGLTFTKIGCYIHAPSLMKGQAFGDAFTDLY
ncbi:hypothetical protein H5410_049276, partial [Solanum commersonii]